MLPRGSWGPEGGSPPYNMQFAFLPIISTGQLGRNWNTREKLETANGLIKTSTDSKNNFQFTSYKSLERTLTFYKERQKHEVGFLMTK